MLAVERETAESLKQKPKKEREPEDKRNLYLAREGERQSAFQSTNFIMVPCAYRFSSGQILADTEAFKTLSDHDQTRRKHLDAENKIKRSNPNYFVSKVCALASSVHLFHILHCDISVFHSLTL